MIIQIKLTVAKALFKAKLIDHTWKNKDKLGEGPRAMEYEVVKIKRVRLKIAHDVPKSIIDKIDRYIEAAESPEANEIKTLDEFKAALTSYIKALQTKWFWINGFDGFMLPYLATDVSMIARTKFVERHVRLNLSYGSIGDGQGEASSTHIRFFIDDLYKGNSFSETLSSGYFDIDEGELGDGDDIEEKVKSKKNTSKKDYMSLRNILFKKGVFYNSDTLKIEYKDQYELWQKIQLQEVGVQYISNSLGYSSGGHYYSSSAIAFKDDGKNCKLVVDEYVIKESGNGFPITYSTSFGQQYLPYHLYVKLYDITLHRPVKSHVSGLIKYVYNKNLLNQLVISDRVKKLINSLVDGEIQMEGKDIIEGKSGGLVILGYGPPGNGKTLTGEIYSEYVEKPLYSIQSSQLGVDVSSIEKKLSDTLRRAERWGCILMIDEADTYVYKRGKDMVQNAIVGTFLRLLEYYNGILFLTTNRKDIVDEAIMSRTTVAIPYDNPVKEDLIKIWKTHIPSFGVNMPDANIEAIADKYPMSGRDVRNALKLLSKYYKDEEITVEAIDFINEYMPSIE
jgi:hypothetical protein